MECGECNIRSSVGYCHECEMLLCEECSHTCERCHQSVCKSHIQRTSSGRNICVTCVVQHYDKRARKAKERREMRAEAAVIGDQQPQSKGRKRAEAPAPTPPSSRGGGFSFEALNDGEEPISAGPSFGASDGPEPFSPLADTKALNDRVLTGSAGKRTPPWFSGSMLVVVAWGLCLGSFGASEIGAQRLILNFLAVFIAAGAVLWTGPGALSKEESRSRSRCRVAFTIGLVCMAYSGLILYQRLVG